LSTAAASLSGTLAVTGTSTFNSGQNVLYASFDNDAALFQRVGAYGAVVRLGRSGVSQTATIDYPADGTFAVSTAGVERIRATAAGNVGIGTILPLSLLDIENSSGSTLTLGTAAAAGTTGAKKFTTINLNGYNNNTMAQIQSWDESASTGQGYLTFSTFTGSALTEKLRILYNGGITFNGDTAAANALDDYEEGTWTMGVSFGGGTTGITYTSSTGGYTKIGRQVTVTGYLVLTSKGSSTGSARITGLPFTIATAASNYSAPILYFENISFANQFQGFGVNGETSIALYETTEAGTLSTLNDADFSNSSAIIISFTYFV
jgi:hypothetical protein